MALLISTIVGVLIAWTVLALGVGVLLGRMCRHRDRQVCLRDAGDLRPDASERAGIAPSSADAVRRWGS